MPIQVLQCHAAMMQRIERGGVDLERAPHQPLGLLEFAALKMRESQKIQGVELPGLKLQHVAIHAAGLGQLPFLMEAKRALEKVIAHAFVAAAGSSITIAAGGSPSCWSSDMAI